MAGSWGPELPEELGGTGGPSQPAPAGTRDSNTGQLVDPAEREAERKKNVAEAKAKRELYNTWGPGAEKEIDRGLYGQTEREGTQVTTVDAAMRNAQDKANSMNALRAFDVDPATKVAFNKNTGDTVTPGAATMDQGRTNTALGTAGRYLEGQNQTRGSQFDQLGYLQRLQTGQGPSVGGLMADQGANRASGMMQDAGAQASRAMMMSQGQAQGSYLDATANQGMLNRRAAFEAASQLQDNASANVRAQASLAARARGSNIGASLLNAQNNVNATNQRAGIDTGRMLSSSMMQTSDQAANAMRLANQGDLQARLQAAGSLERGNINAAMTGRDMLLEGAKIRSGEQLQATGMVNDTLGGMRGQDISAGQAATGLAGVGLQADSAMSDLDRFNVGLDFQGQTFNADNDFRFDDMNQRNRLETNRLNLEDDRMRELANQDAQLKARGLYGTEAMGYTEMGIRQEDALANRGIRGEEFETGVQSHGLDRMANVMTGQQTNATNLQMQKDANATAERNQNWNTAATVAGTTAAVALPIIFGGTSDEAGAVDDPTAARQGTAAGASAYQAGANPNQPYNYMRRYV